MEHESSILYEPFNKYIWRHAFGVDVPDHVLMAGLVILGHEVPPDQRLHPQHGQGVRRNSRSRKLFRLPD